VQLSRRQIIAYAAVAVVVVAVGVRYVVLPRSAGPSEANAVVLAPAASSSSAAGGTGAEGGGSSWATAASPSPSASPDLVVYVCGAVRAPGVVRLPAGARVTDALQIAGGPTGKAELAAVNLAAPVTDGQQIVVPEKGATSAVTVAPAGGASGGLGAAGGTSGPAAPVNINTASLEELDALDGVGPSTAQKIIDYRTEHGGFKTIDEIKEVPGIGDAKFAAMKDSITV
jgi:competence protein ComEA